MHGFFCVQYLFKYRIACDVTFSVLHFLLCFRSYQCVFTPFRPLLKWGLIRPFSVCALPADSEKLQSNHHMDRRILNPIQISSAEIVSRNLPFSKDDLVINIDTGEMRVGGGKWHELVSYNGQCDIDATVRVATTANVTIATALNAGDTIDGVALADGDLVLVKNQSTPAQNGIYVAGTTPVRSGAFNTIPELAQALVSVTAGTANAGKLFRSTGATSGTIDSTDVTFGQVVQGGLRFAALGELAQLPAKTAYSATDLVLLEQADGTKVKMALSDFKTNMA